MRVLPPSKARKLQEAYAFKGAVASSFDAYRDLIEKISKDPALKGYAEYSNFITQTIRGLYEVPSMEQDDDEHPPHTKVLKETAALVKEIGKLVNKVN